jgi:hypothetical protein
VPQLKIVSAILDHAVTGAPICHLALCAPFTNRITPFAMRAAYPSTTNMFSALASRQIATDIRITLAIHSAPARPEKCAYPTAP